MHYERLPAGSKMVGSAADTWCLTELLERAKQGYSMYFHALEPIEQAPITGSVLYASTAFAAHEHHLSKPLSSEEVAQKLIDSIPASQYPTQAEHRVKWRKGWDVLTATGPRGFIIIVLANWVAP
ncbi:hypothetical protein K2Q00_01790 [Patescibacteria group bacterium]|nr:hypothetical protein [Patescibacteria group bacterium]